MKAVILAAGDGGRLRPLTLETPKVLLHLAGKPIVARTVDALLWHDIHDIAVILGHNAHKIIGALKSRPRFPSLRFLTTPHWTGGNAISLYKAKEYVGESPFVLAMGDHVVAPPIVERLLAVETLANVLCVDYRPFHTSQTKDATKVWVDPMSRIVEIGKELISWNGVDIGYFRLTPQVFGVIEELWDRLGMEMGMSDVVRRFAEVGQPFVACDVTGLPWFDIDTPEDLEAVNRLFMYEAE